MGRRGTVRPLEVLDGKISEGNKITVCGAGLVGCEVAMLLAELGIDVKVNHNIDRMNCTSTECTIEDDEVRYEGDAVIHALGLKSDRTLLDKLRNNLKDIDIIPIGDVNQPRKIIQAVHEGYHAARRI